MDSLVKPWRNQFLGFFLTLLPLLLYPRSSISLLLSLPFYFLFFFHLFIYLSLSTFFFFLFFCFFHLDFPCFGLYHFLHSLEHLVIFTFSVKTTESGLSLFYFLSHFYFLSWFIFHFSIFRTMGLGLEVIDHISHTWWYGHNIDYGTWEKVVEGSGTRWYHII